jgi:DNA repair photolyase
MTNMYEWIDVTKNFIAGQCPHQCPYCYVKSSRFTIVKERYSGPIRLLVNEFKKPLPAKKTIFVCDCNDMFAEKVPDFMVNQILEYCKVFDNTFIFQTKNPSRMHSFHKSLPKNCILGTTIESNRPLKSLAPVPADRAEWIGILSKSYRTFVTIEPIMDFDLSDFVGLIKLASPSFVNIGADSKNHHLPEPSREKVNSLVEELKMFTAVRLKDNLKRLL